MSVAQTAEQTISILDQVTFAIAVVGFLLSVYNFVASLVANSKRLEFSVKHLCKSGNIIGLVFEITNKSRLGISLTSGNFILENGEKIPFGETSTLAIAQKLPYMEHDAIIKSRLFPIRLEPLMSARVFMQTDCWDSDLPNSCKFFFSTSRGSFQGKVDLPDTLKDGLQLLRYLE